MHFSLIFLIQVHSQSTCPLGTFSADLGAGFVETCTLCERGFYKDWLDAPHQCTQCPVGKTTSGTGSVGCQNIQTFISCTSQTSYCGTGGTVSTRRRLLQAGACHCCSGQFLTISVDSVSCTSCNAGTFMDLQYHQNENCLLCPNNSTSSEASKDPSACVCNAGYSPMLALGSATPPLSCSACPAGKFKPATSKAPSAPLYTYINSEKCQDCDAGKYAALPIVGRR
jgi:hypothetical protein